MILLPSLCFSVSLLFVVSLPRGVGFHPPLCSSYPFQGGRLPRKVVFRVSCTDVAVIFVCLWMRWAQDPSTLPSSSQRTHIHFSTVCWARIQVRDIYVGSFSVPYPHPLFLPYYLFNLHYNSEKDSISSVYKGGNWGPERLSNFLHRVSECL